ncbi:AGAP011398-PA-like protein [Anopheles sinensis]|uniref:AGAP011398-PA-like protein n=1 Tax=Anopheles sinensis TaxID=74873 RepID=A0A084WB26_ANOSI|nr:AGAP011398-PA-like protein [Anopheles sinensis]
MTHIGTVVGRSKSVDDLTSVDDIERDDGKRLSETTAGGPELEKLLRSKDEQIAKLVEKLSTVFECNNQFAVEHEKLQKDYQQAMQNLHTLQGIKAKSCDQCASFETERDQLAKENGDLRNDVKMMKILVYRLNVQIERYQDAIREGTTAKNAIPRLDFVDSTYGGAKDNLNWGPVNSHTLGPLLNAYEETIAEKSDLVQQYESELVGFTGKLKKVLEENESLQQEMETMRAAQAGWTSERTRLQAQVDVLRSKADVQGKRADLAKEKLVEVLKCYEQKVQAQSLDIQRLQEAYSRSKGELATLRNLNHNPELVANSLKECQQYDLTQKATELEQLRNDYQQQLKIFERQKEINEILMGKNAALKQTLERTRQSKEILKQRLKTMITWGKGSEQRKDQLQESWQTIRALQAQLQQRDGQLRSLQQRYQTEVEQLERRLRQREDTLRKILAEKAQFHRQV